jgi:hypothetical protein
MKYMNITYRPNLNPISQEEKDQIMAKFVVQKLNGEFDVHQRLIEAAMEINKTLLQGELSGNSYNVVYTNDRSISYYLTTMPGMDTYQPILDVITYLEFKNPAYPYEEIFLKQVHSFDKAVYANTARHQSGKGLLKKRLAELRPIIIAFLHQLLTHIKGLEEELTRLIGPRVFPKPKVDVAAMFARS